MGLISFLRVNVSGAERGTVKVCILEDFEKKRAVGLALRKCRIESDDYYHLKIIEALLKIKKQEGKKLNLNKRNGVSPDLDTILAAN